MFSNAKHLVVTLSLSLAALGSASFYDGVGDEQRQLKALLAAVERAGSASPSDYRDYRRYDLEHNRAYESLASFYEGRGEWQQALDVWERWVPRGSSSGVSTNGPRSGGSTMRRRLIPRARYGFTIVTLLLVLPTVEPPRCQDPNRLEPCHPLLTAEPDHVSYVQFLRKVLELDKYRTNHGTLAARMIVEVPLVGEWVLNLYLPDQGDAVIELIASDHGSWDVQDVVDVSKTRTLSTIDRHTAEQVVLAWKAQILQTSYPDDLFDRRRGPCLDGVRYTFGDGDSCGSINCRTESSPVDLLVELGLHLYRYAKAPAGEGRETELEQVRELAKVLAKGLEAKVKTGVE